MAINTQWRINQFKGLNNHKSCVLETTIFLVIKKKIFSIITTKDSVLQLHIHNSHITKSFKVIKMEKEVGLYLNNKFAKKHRWILYLPKTWLMKVTMWQVLEVIISNAKLR